MEHLSKARNMKMISITLHNSTFFLKIMIELLTAKKKPKKTAHAPTLERYSFTHLTM